MRKLLTSIALLSILFAVGCEKTEAKNKVTPKGETSTVAQSEVSSTSNKMNVLFFMNPMGSPCQMQDRILNDMGTILTDKAEVTYIKTTEMEKARPMFMKYGIRALPSMIVLNNDGSVRHRFSPGIISSENLSAILN
jgi:thioredoxin-related protein